MFNIEGFFIHMMVLVKLFLFYFEYCQHWTSTGYLNLINNGICSLLTVLIVVRSGL